MRTVLGTLSLLLVASAAFAPSLGATSAVPAAPAGAQTALVFSFPEGGYAIEYLGSLAPDHEVEQAAEGWTIRVYDEGRANVVLLAKLAFPPGTVYVETVLVPELPEVFEVVTPAEGENHANTCDANSWYCADLDVQTTWDGKVKTWHGLQVNEGAPAGAEPQNVYYKVACDSMNLCNAHMTVEQYVHPEPNVIYGSLHCKAHTKPPNTSSQAIWTQVHRNGVAVSDPAWTTTINTAC